MFFITVTAHVSCRQCLQLSTELQTHKNNGNAVNINISASLRRARDGTRTRDPDLGKVVLHQLSHSRINSIYYTCVFEVCQLYLKKFAAVVTVQPEMLC